LAATYAVPVKVSGGRYADINPGLASDRYSPKRTRGRPINNGSGDTIHSPHREFNASVARFFHEHLMLDDAAR